MTEFQDPSAGLDVMSDEDLQTGLQELRESVADIERQMDDYEDGVFVRDEGWMHRAASARRHKLRMVDRWLAESNRREKIDRHEQRIREIQEAEARRVANIANSQVLKDAADERLARKVEAHKELMAAEAIRTDTKAGLFLAASMACLSKDQRKVIWDKAQEMFPGHAAFQDMRGL